LRIQGYQCYGLEEWRGKSEHTFQITHDMLLETGLPVEDMVTHVFPLGEYRNALSTAANRSKTGAVKVLLDPNVS
jgi:L-iditol 2-dehydrogenase